MKYDLQHIKNFLKDHYFSGQDEIELSLIKAGVENDNLVVRTNSDTYIFRIYNQSHSIRGKRELAQIELELEFTEHAIQQGIPAPKVITSHHGKRILEIKFDMEIHFCSLFEFLLGKSPSEFNQTIAMEVGKTVNKIFVVGKNFHNQSVLTGNNSIVDRAFSIYQQAREQLKLDLPDSLIKLHQKLIYQLPEIESKQLSQGLVHGDIKLENLLFKDDQLTAVLDFDDFRYSYLLEEAVMTLMHNLHSKSENLLRSGNYQGFINQLTESELKAELPDLKFFLQVRYLYDLCKYLMSGKNELVSQLQIDPMINKYLLD